MEDTTFYSSYLAIFIFICITISIALVIILLPQFLAKNNPQKNKLSPYECGFEPVQEDNISFNIKFYLIAISFIVFDVEIVFLLPWALQLKQISNLSFYSAISFIAILTVGFIYEWRKQALDNN